MKPGAGGSPDHLSTPPCSDTQTLQMTGHDVEDLDRVELGGAYVSLSPWSHPRRFDPRSTIRGRASDPADRRENGATRNRGRPMHPAKAQITGDRSRRPVSGQCLRWEDQACENSERAFPPPKKAWALGLKRSLDRCTRWPAVTHGAEKA